MGLAGGIGRTLAAPFLLLNLAICVICLGIAGHYLDKITVGKIAMGNGATTTFILLTLIGVAAAVASYIAGLHHLRVWKSESGGSAQGTAWTAWFLIILAFILAWKEIHIGHVRPVKLRVLEAFVIILTATHFIYTVILHLGDRTDTTTGVPHKPMNPNASAPAPASAV